MLDFNGQVVLITGAGSPKGIGRTIAHTFARQGAQVVITDITLLVERLLELHLVCYSTI